MAEKKKPPVQYGDDPGMVESCTDYTELLDVLAPDEIEEFKEKRRLIVEERRKMSEALAKRGIHIDLNFFDEDDPEIDDEVMRSVQEEVRRESGGT